MEQLLSFILAIAALSVGLAAFFLAVRTLFPRRVARTRALAELMPGRSFGVGLVNGLFFGLIAFILLSIANNLFGLGRAVITLPALFCLTLLGVGLSFGLSGMVELIGERLAPAQTAFWRTAWGTLALSFGSAVPLVGWFLLLPYAGLVGMGAFIISFFWREQSPTAVPQPPNNPV